MPTKQIESLSASAMAKSRLKSGGRDGFLGHRVLIGSLARRQIDREKCESRILADLINTVVVDVGRRFECRIGKRGHVRMNAPQIAQSPEKEVSSLGLSTAAVAEALEMVLGGLALQATDERLSACEPLGCNFVALQEDRDGERQALLQRSVQALDLVLLGGRERVSALDLPRCEFDEVGGQDVARMLDINGEPQNFLGATAVCLIEIFGAQARQVRAHRVPQPIEVLVEAVQLRSAQPVIATQDVEPSIKRAPPFRFGPITPRRS